MPCQRRSTAVIFFNYIVLARLSRDPARFKHGRDSPLVAHFGQAGGSQPASKSDPIEALACGRSDGAELLFDTLQRIPYWLLARLVRHYFALAGGLVYDIDLVRSLCREIADEKDPLKVEELICLLQAVVKENQEEIQARMAFLAKKYAIVIGGAKVH